MEYNIEPYSPGNISLDWRNPRLAEFGITKKTPLDKIFELMWEAMGLEEIIISITAHGFFKTEPIIITEEEGKKIVIEGNRRLSAVKIILNPDLVKRRLPKNVLEKITPELQKSLQEKPVIEVESREQAWQFIGFKHINGAAKWNSYAKAKYIAQVHNDFNIPLDDIAYQVGDTHNTVLKLYQGIMVIDQAERLKRFDREDITNSRLYFSHLYTALQYSGYKEFLGMTDTDMESTEPISEEYYDNLEILLKWMYGSKSAGFEPVIRSQNPDLRNLEKVLQSTEATLALKANPNLDIAFEISRPSKDVFIENLMATKRSLHKTWSFVSGYSGEPELLRTAGSVAEMADQLYDQMDKKYREENERPKRKRLSEED